MNEQELKIIVKKIPLQRPPANEQVQQIVSKQKCQRPGNCLTLLCCKYFIQCITAFLNCNFHAKNLQSLFLFIIISFVLLFKFI